MRNSIRVTFKNQNGTQCSVDCVSFILYTDNVYEFKYTDAHPELKAITTLVKVEAIYS